ncbi:MAG: extracellular solute-binding protein [Bdellovibrionales bacterium]
MRFSLRTPVLAALLASALLFAPGCRAEKNPAPRTAIAMHGEPKYAAGFDHFNYVNSYAPKGGALKLGVTGTFDSLNPFIVRGQVPIGISLGYLSVVYQPLMARSWDEPFSLYGLIAETVEVPEDRSFAVFNLRADARWQDGKPVTADDVLFSYRMLRDKGRPNTRTFYKKVEKAERLGALRVKFSFRRNADGTTDREMPLIMGLMPILPKHDWADRAFNETTLRLPVGSGPYKMTKVDPGRSVAYTRDPNYWGKDLPVQRGMYNVDNIQIDYYRDDNIALEAFKAGAFDWRREFNANKWATAYDFPAVRDGRVKLKTDTHHRTEPAAGFIFNTRRMLFKDKALRAALQYTFDFNWINRTLFHSQYKRVTSFFPNSELAAPPLPEGKELAILEKHRAQLPPDIFTRPVTPPASPSEENGMRDNLLKASEMLREADYILHDDLLYAPQASAPVKFEILLSDPAEEKVALEWSRLLRRIGITASIHTVDSAQYQSRMAKFDFDVTAGRWTNSLSPGNEQASFWGSAAADQPGSRNYPGIRDPVIDALANAIPAAATREDLVATVHALDRVLMAGHYTIPLYFSDGDRVAWWAERLERPDDVPLYGTVLESWWSKKTAQ